MYKPGERPADLKQTQTDESQGDVVIESWLHKLKQIII